MLIKAKTEGQELVSKPEGETERGENDIRKIDTNGNVMIINLMIERIINV